MGDQVSRSFNLGFIYSYASMGGVLPRAQSVHGINAQLFLQRLIREIIL